MSERSIKSRPEPRWEDGHFIPAYPVPEDRPLDSYGLLDNFKTLGSVVRNPLETFNYSQFVDPVSQFSLFGNQFTIINDPDLIAYCFVKNSGNYRLQRVRQRILKPLLRNGLITAEGEQWRQARRRLSPMFTPRYVNQFAKSMQEVCAKELPRLINTNSEFLFAEAMSELTYLVLSETLFSNDLAEDTKDMVADVGTFLKYMGRPDPMDILGAPKWVPRLTTLPGRSSVKNLRNMVNEIYQKRQTQMDKGEDLPVDFLTLLLRSEEEGVSIPPEEIIDHVISFIGAGHETTARALAWLFYLLANDQSVRSRLEDEIDAFDMDGTPPHEWADKLPFAKACFQETMRIFPPAPFVFREAINDDIYNDIEIPADSTLSLNTWILHRHTQLWDRPEAFIPERFLEGAERPIDRFQYLPFGAGPRICIGQSFAMKEAVILIAMLVKSFRFEYAGSQPPWPLLRITIQPDNKMPMRAAARQ